MPASAAVSMMRPETASSVWKPNVIVPRHRRETVRPVRPSLRYSIEDSSESRAVWAQRSKDNRRLKSLLRRRSDIGLSTKGPWRTFRRSENMNEKIDNERRFVDSIDDSELAFLRIARSASTFAVTNSGQ